MKQEKDLTGEIVIYQPDETIRLEVKIEDETVWLSQQQMAELFNATKQNVSLHIKNIYDERELMEPATVKDYLTVRKEGKRIALEHQVADLRQKVDFFVRTSLPPVEGIFFDGQIFDAYRFASDLVRKAKKSVVLIDDEVYHIGASLKDLGKKWFAFTLLHDIMASELLNRIGKV